MTHLLLGILIGWILARPGERASGGGVWYDGRGHKPAPPTSLPEGPPPHPPPAPPNRVMHYGLLGVREVEQGAPRNLEVTSGMRAPETNRGGAK